MNKQAEDRSTIDQLLERIEKLEKKTITKIKPWYKDPAIKVSLLALVSSIGLGVFSFVKDASETLRLTRQELSGVITELTTINEKEAELQKEAYLDSQNNGGNINYPYFENLSSAYANKRWILLASADNLVERLGDEVTTAELAVLGIAYLANQDIDTAEKYYKRLIVEGESPFLVATGMRSLANLYIIKGKSSLGDAESYYESGLAILDNEKLPGLIAYRALIAKEWGQGLAAYGRFDAAIKKYDESLDIYRMLPQGMPSKTPYINAVQLLQRHAKSQMKLNLPTQ